LATALVENSFEELDGVLRDLVDAEPIRRKLETYFDSFATADFFQELHELGSTLKIRENFETYLYVGELRFNRASYPLFYLSLSVELEDRIFRITADPHRRCLSSTVTSLSAAVWSRVGAEKSR
jgi:hypothetical protein